MRSEVKVGDPLVQSYVRRRFFVSTKRRLSSATSGPSTYYETGVFELDEEMRPVKTMAIVDVGVSSKSALKGHFEICRQVCEKIAAEDDNE